MKFLSIHFISQRHRAQIFPQVKDAWPIPLSGPLFTKTPSYGYRDYNYKPKTVWRPAQVYNGNPYWKDGGVFLVNRGPADQQYGFWYLVPWGFKDVYYFSHLTLSHPCSSRQWNCRQYGYKNNVLTPHGSTACAHGPFSSIAKQWEKT